MLPFVREVQEKDRLHLVYCYVCLQRSLFLVVWECLLWIGRFRKRQITFGLLLSFSWALLRSAQWKQRSLFVSSFWIWWWCLVFVVQRQANSVFSFPLFFFSSTLGEAASRCSSGRCDWLKVKWLPQGRQKLLIQFAVPDFSVSLRIKLVSQLSFHSTVTRYLITSCNALSDSAAVCWLQLPLCRLSNRLQEQHHLEAECWEESRYPAARHRS